MPVLRSASPCTEALAPAIDFQARRASFGGRLPAGASPQLQKACQGTGDITPPDKPAQEAEDRATLCLLLCCCNSNPSVALTGRNYRQLCVADTLQTVDQDLGYQSRFKAEVSYNMAADPPSPVMSPDVFGGASTEPAQGFGVWAQKELGGFGGQVRRPDVVVVNNPAMPPVQGNIDRIYEMKFPGDREKLEQVSVYDRIGGSDGKTSILNTVNCGCDKKETQEQVAHKLANARNAQDVARTNLLSQLQRLFQPPRIAPFPSPAGEPIPLPIP